MQEFFQELAINYPKLNFVFFYELEDGISPKDVVYAEDKMVLYHYKPRVEKQNPIPLLIVYALVNRPYMADLQEGRSMIQGLLDAGIDVYLVDWGYPDEGDRYITLEDYINGYLDIVSIRSVRNMAWTRLIF